MSIGETTDVVSSQRNYVVLVQRKLTEVASSQRNYVVLVQRKLTEVASSQRNMWQRKLIIN